MPSYISEFCYYGNTTIEFVEIALPAGTDPSGYSVVIYNSDGTQHSSYPLGTVQNTMAGHDVYVIDDSAAGFSSGDSAGNFVPGSAVALVDGGGTTIQFLSYAGSTVIATEGPSNGLTSVDIGTAGPGSSMQSDDGGSSYYTQSSTNSGTIPACYAPDTQIATPDGPCAVQNLRAGDTVLTASGCTATVKWVWTGEQHFDTATPDQKPVLIRRNRFSIGIPSRDLVVSAQHRIVVGAHNQLAHIFDRPAMAAAKALSSLAGIRHLQDLKQICWHHFVCDRHETVVANGVASETLLLGSQIVQNLAPADRTALATALGRRISKYTVQTTALPCLTVQHTRSALRHAKTRVA